MRSLSQDNLDSEGSVRSTASGAAKRSRSRRRRTKRFRGRYTEMERTSSEEERGEEASASAGERASEERGKKDRPIMTSRGVGIRAQKEVERKLAKTIEQICRAQDIIEGGYEP